MFCTDDAQTSKHFDVFSNDLYFKGFDSKKTSLKQLKLKTS